MERVKRLNKFLGIPCEEGFENDTLKLIQVTEEKKESKIGWKNLVRSRRTQPEVEGS